MADRANIKRKLQIEKLDAGAKLLYNGYNILPNILPNVREEEINAEIRKGVQPIPRPMSKLYRNSLRRKVPSLNENYGPSIPLKKSSTPYIRSPLGKTRRMKRKKLTTHTDF